MTASITGRVFALSNAALVGEEPLAYAREALISAVEGRRIAHLPFANVGADSKLDGLREAVTRMGGQIIPVTDPRRVGAEADRADVLLVSGGNTFQLLARLQEQDLLSHLRSLVAGGTTYIGISAGTNILSPSIATTNSMPIAEVSSLAALGLLPFQLNCHYPGQIIDPHHAGESRDERITEYLTVTGKPVLGLREGSWLERDGTTLTLHGRGARLFHANAPTTDFSDGASLDSLLTTDVTEHPAHF